MQVKIQDLLPAYFAQERKQDSEFWGKDLVFEKGELIKIVAPSGRGKSSLINFMYGLRNDFNGDISYNSKNIKGLSIEDLSRYRRKQVSIVFQDLRLFPTQTIRENLEIKRQLKPFHPAEKIVEMAARLGIEDRLDYPASTCSYGEQQRAAIIRSLLQPFELLLLDEPFSHLDNRNAEKAMTLIMEESAVRKATVIFADLERSEFFPYTRLYHL
jgi:ABC-type lipoprotein export system ATPase subunit